MEHRGTSSSTVVTIGNRDRNRSRKVGGGEAVRVIGLAAGRQVGPCYRAVGVDNDGTEHRPQEDVPAGRPGVPPAGPLIVSVITLSYVGFLCVRDGRLAHRSP